eukprot:Skav227986  [mRNA]  locus=scaffold390:8482:10561:- [translate_table: standard]
MGHLLPLTRRCPLLRHPRSPDLPRPRSATPLSPPRAAPRARGSGHRAQRVPSSTPPFAFLLPPSSWPPLLTLQAWRHNPQLPILLSARQCQWSCGRSHLLPSPFPRSS